MTTSDYARRAADLRRRFAQVESVYLRRGRLSPRWARELYRIRMQIIALRDQLDTHIGDQDVND